MKHSDVAIIGGGIVGLATAYQLLQRQPDIKLILLEKEQTVAAHQTGHNSGVLHSGIYYRPGSLKAANCRAGKQLMQEFCTQEEIPFDLCGKVIVAVDDVERQRLQNIYERGLANGIACELIDRPRLLELEPHASGLAAIHVPEAGIVDYKVISRRLAERIRQAGGEIYLDAEVTGIEHRPHSMIIRCQGHELETRHLVTCGGLWADRVIKLAGVQPVAPIVPFRGEYFVLKPEAEQLCRGLIYPTPDPKFPFLGVHFTRMIQGGVECGPNAVLAYARDGYRKTDINLRDLYDALSYRGFRSMACKYWQTGLEELWRSWSKAAFVRALQRLVPEIRAEHLTAAPAGVRAQALGKDGSLLDDFVIQQTENMIHVNNAPSPAATASLNIGKLIVDKMHHAGWLEG